jgi:iron complex transport system substrate-binding protein
VRLRTSGIVAALLVAAGCAAPSTAAPVEQAPAAGFPVTIEHALGSTTIPAPHERAVAAGAASGRAGARGGIVNP